MQRTHGNDESVGDLQRSHNDDAQTLVYFIYYTARYLAAQCIVIGPVCVFVCLQRAGGRAGGRADGVRTLLQPARAQCLRLSERFFIYLFIYLFIGYATNVAAHTLHTQK